VIIPGKTAFIYCPFDVLEILQSVVGLNDPSKPVPEYNTFDELYSNFVSVLSERINGLQNHIDNVFTGGYPATLISMLIDGCIEKGRGYNDRGARYTITAPHAGGMADTCNSLLVIKKLVFEEKLVSLREFIEISQNNWERNEPLRKLIRNRFEFYGNDNGPTAVIKSYCKMNFERLPNGGTLELKIHPSCMKGEDGLESIVSLLKLYKTHVSQLSAQMQ